LLGINPHTYCTDVLTKLNPWPASRLNEFMLGAWAAQRSAKLAA
jgi:hypothetical protein